MRRAGIFLIYDADGIVDRYVEYLLQDITKCLEKLFIVCNGSLQRDEEKKLLAFADEVCFRENVGYDVAAFKYMITNRIGVAILQQYDELVVFNDTFYGPFTSFRDVFDEMDQKEYDFWGITRYDKSILHDEHIQSYFINYGSKLLHSEDFSAFWNNVDDTATEFEDVVRNYELTLSRMFLKKGYRMGAYVDNRMLSHDDPLRTYNYYLQSHFDLLKSCRMPVLKKKNFKGQDKTYTAYNDLPQCMEYIKNHTEYDVDLIWRNVIRNCTPYQLYRSMNLRFVLQKNEETYGGECFSARVAILVRATGLKMLPQFCDYIKGIPAEANLIMLTEKQMVEELRHRLIDLTERRAITILACGDNEADVYGKAYQETVSKYDYLCHITLPSEYVDGVTYCENNAAAMNIWDNLLGNGQYIDAIIHLFESNPRMGLLIPPILYETEVNERSFMDPWDGMYEDVNSIAGTLGIKTSAQDDDVLFVKSNSFWCRTDAIDLDGGTDCFYQKSTQEINHIVSRLLPFMVRKNGFYTAIVESDWSARRNTENAENITRRLMKQYRGLYSDGGMRMITLEEEMEKQSVVVFCRKYASVYIYGAGKRGRHVCEYLNYRGVEVCGFISSSGTMLADSFMKRKMYHLSDVREHIVSERQGLIVAVSKQFRDEIQRELDDNEVREYVWI